MRDKPDLILQFQGLDKPPSVNHLYVLTSRGVTLSTEARRWREAIAWRVKAETNRQQRAIPQPPCFISIRYCLRTTRMDLDAPLKTLIDGMVKDGLFIEDQWVGSISASKELVSKATSEGIDVEIRVWQLGNRGEFTEMSRRVTT